MESLGLMQKYDDFQNTNISSVEYIPCGWRTLRFHDVFSFSKGLNITKENLQEDGIPCLNYGEIHSKFGFELRPEIHPLKCVDEKYLKNNKKSILRFGDFIFADTSEDYEGAGNFTYLNSEDEIFAGYHTLICRLKIGVNERYLAYVVDSEAFRLQVRRAVKGVKVFSITQGLLKGTKLWLASEAEQTRIANFLDKKTAQIDEAIAIKQQQMSLLKERKQIIIQQAVTQGLNPDVPMKDSCVDWIGKIPEHWEVKRLKYVTKIVKRIIGYEGPDVLSITQKGIKVKDIESGEGQLAMDYSKYQVVRVGDFAMNHMDLLTGYVDISQFEGVVSPDYRVFINTYNGLRDDFLLSIFQLGYQQKIFYRYGQGVSLLGRWRFPADNFNNFFIPVPPIEEQAAIVHSVQREWLKLDNAIELLISQIEKLKEYKATLINSAVTGKIKITPEMVEQ